MLGGWNISSIITIQPNGFPLTVIGHRNREPVEDLVGRGASEARTGQELAEKSDIVVLCVTGSPQVEEYRLLTRPKCAFTGIVIGLPLVSVTRSAENDGPL